MAVNKNVKSITQFHPYMKIIGKFTTKYQDNNNSPRQKSPANTIPKDYPTLVNDKIKQTTMTSNSNKMR